MQRERAITSDLFAQVAAQYRRRWRVPLCACDEEGEVVLGKSAGAWMAGTHAPIRRLAIEEALRWGEPTVEPAPGAALIWAVPLMHNSSLLGGLVAGVAERRLFASGSGKPALDIRLACSDLRRLAEEHNLTNAALLESRRHEYLRERTRAEAIHSVKGAAHYDMRSMYLLEEPALVAAIRKGDRGEARAILNRLLVGMIHRAGPRLELAKSFFMELVATITRTAVEAGGDPQEMLGANYASIAELGAITADQELARWLHEMLERAMDCIHRNRTEAQVVQLANALRFMAERCTQDISRDDAAAAACLSSSHFSRLFRKQMGRSFTDLLNQMRTDRAAALLAQSDRPLKMVSLDCGFADQSYFTKVFRRYQSMTPAEYRSRQMAT